MLILHSAMETKHSSSSSSSHYYCAEQLLTLITAMSCFLLEAFLITTAHVAAADSTDDNYYFPSSNVDDNLFSYYGNPEYNSLSYSNFQVCNNQTLLQALNNEKRLYGRALGIYSAHISEYPYILYFQLFFVIPGDAFCTRSNASTPSYYLSLLAYKGYGKAQDPNKGQVVWTANVDNPVGENACLELNAGDTNLKLVDYDRNGPDRVVWQTNTSTLPINASLTITFEGNLVLFTNTTGTNASMLTQDILWQSYEHPTDTLMVLQALRPGYNLTASSDSNKTVNYTLMIGPAGTVALYAKIRYESHYNHSSNNSTVSYSSYEYPYWVWPTNGAPDTSTGDAMVLCWYSTHNSSLQLDILPSANRSKVSRYTQNSPDDCGSSGWKAFEFEDTGKEDEANNLTITYGTFLRLESDGDLHAYTLNDTRYPNSTTIWQNFSSLFDGRSLNPCRLPLFCGFYGVCQEEFQNCSLDCGGSQTFVLQDPTNPKSGCKLKDDSELMEPNSTTLSDLTLCHSKNFSVIQGARYFSNAFRSPDHSRISPKDCSDKCKDICSCTAAFWESSSAASCFLIQGPVATIIVVNASAREEFQGFLTLIDISTPSSSSSLLIFIRVGLPVLGVITVMAMLVAGYLCRRRRLQAKKLNDNNDMEAELLGASLQGAKPRRFTWKEMHENTCGFSDHLGSGGFGKVFRGAMDDGTPIAVKQLNNESHQGNKEFIAEVSILGRTHHLHLVRLIGFCLEGTMHKLLVYEYMENGSLDAWIFRKTHKETDESTENNRRPVLTWERRFDIALGTAKGLAYLHEECEDRIIHMDLKPQNILLGADFFPKISDFGMSRRVVKGEESAVVTMMRGTPGYLAPEWINEGAVTVKCDVYSYGIVLLEIVSGRKVKDWRALRQKLDMSRNLSEGVRELVDERLMSYGVGAAKKKMYDEKQAMRMVEVAMMCLRTDPGSRPSMSRVVHMLEGKVEAISLHDAPISEDYQEMGLLIPSKKMKDGLELELEQEQQYKHHFSEIQWPNESWVSRSGTTSTTTTMGRTRKSIFSGKTSYKYMQISKSEEYMDSLDPGHTYRTSKQ